MPKKITTEIFIERANIIHSNKYDYSKTKYTGCYTPVCIICPIHGDFEQKPYLHLYGDGCQKCGLIHRDSTRRVYGVGWNDVEDKVDGTEYHKKWLYMLNRCYHPSQIEHSRSYNNVYVCDEWLKLSNFRRWFEDPNNGYREGYELDKDLLIKGNKVYSPDACCFIPSEINSALKLTRKKKSSGLPIGVVKIKLKTAKPYRADFGRKTIGYYLTPEEAFNAYKAARESYIKNMATEYFNDKKITRKVYDALMNFNISIND